MATISLIRTGCQQLVKAGRDFLYPPACPLCEQEVAVEDSRTDGFCPNCESLLNPPIPFSCKRCGAPVGPFAVRETHCVHCQRDRFAFEKILRLNVYKDELQTACLRAKQPGGLRLSWMLGKFLGTQIQQEVEECGIDLLVPVPHHWTQRLQRQHNPAETIARSLSQVLQVPTSARCLSKIRRTPPQASLTPTDRRKNLRNVFRVPHLAQRKIRGKTILIVDDVLTTGTTAHQIARVLKKAGATRLFVGVVARGLGQT